MSLLNKKVLPALSGERTATVKSFREVENDNGGYVEVILQLSDRDYTYNIFPSQIDYVTSALRRQLGVEDMDELELVLEEGKTKEFRVWFNYNPQYGRMNVALHAPRVVLTEEAVEL